MSKLTPSPLALPKRRSAAHEAARRRAGAGPHRSKARRGSGRGKGKRARHPKHKGQRGW